MDINLFSANMLLLPRERNCLLRRNEIRFTEWWNYEILKSVIKETTYLGISWNDVHVEAFYLAPVTKFWMSPILFVFG